MKLLNQPSLLANRIETVVDSLDEDCNEEEKEFVFHLIVDNFSLLLCYIQETVSSVLHVSSSRMDSPSQSANSSPALLPKSSSLQPSTKPIEFDITIGKEIITTVGKVKRSGIVKIRILDFIEYLLAINPSLFTSCILCNELNRVLIVLIDCFVKE